MKYRTLSSLFAIAVLTAILAPISVAQDAPAQVCFTARCNVLAPGWTLLQDTGFDCNRGTATCTSPTQTSGGNFLLPTTAGSVWIVGIQTGNNVTIESTNGWSQCPSSACHIFDSTNSNNNDLAYQTDGAAGTTSITFTTSANATGHFFGYFIELLPPSGYTASYDTGGAVASTSCTNCAGVGLTLSATDAIFQLNYTGLPSTAVPSWNAYSSPYITDVDGQGVCLNCTSGAAPTIAMGTSTFVDSSAIAFKSTAGSFSTPANVFSLINRTSSGTSAAMSCSPTCTITIPATTAGTLGFLAIGDNSASHRSISSVSCTGCNTFTVPTDCSVTNSTSDQLSCA